MHRPQDGAVEDIATDGADMMDQALMALRAGGRASMYHLFVWIFGCLPDQDYLRKIKDDAFINIFEHWSEMDNNAVEVGVDYIRTYQLETKTRPDEEVLNELSVDCTRIIRGIGHQDFKPPYENLYHKNKETCESILEIRQFYRKAGIFPEERVCESADHICVELDFMKQLCLRERNKWAADRDASETVTLQDTFLRKHLGSWIGEFSGQVQEHSRTDFYRGCAKLAKTFIQLDLAYLENLIILLK